MVRLQRNRRSWRGFATGFCLIAAATVLDSSRASAQTPFYAGKQITLIAGAAVGGGYDLLTRLTARHLGRHIAGHPAIIVQNMPAAASLAATNYLYNTAPKDGTVIALIQRGMLLAKWTNPSGVRFELERLGWIGSVNSETGLTLAWHTAPQRSAADLFTQELIVGAHAGVDPDLTPRLYNALIGTRFKVVIGYNGTADIALAMERGEVQGIADWSWTSLRKMRPDWLRDHKVRLLMQGGLQRHPGLADLPSALEFVKADADRRVLELYFTQKTLARPVIAPPGLPAPRLAELRAAFAALASDQEFLSDAERSGLEAAPLAGEAVDRIIALIAGTPPELARRLTAAIAPRLQSR
ncbi:MAG TPA: hypothetical protein VH934_02900 [Xanthobacteraceae bacterium]